eukprot:CAMPEP_0114248588 /NCGR_PEP_ID=MMETSP0058-20121206/13654_1 /TAXON_ID=36894 /ORGANISM="Pyramimonas parkeae, CCMP726" /LENGTH=378 /DNA_ID=CAMNT_0001362007 /DNA_START=268 /DNA_END=1404 /DNA_ORIENTATION=+
MPIVEQRVINPEFGPDGKENEHGISHIASEHCTRFVVFAREGSGANHFMKVLDSFPDVSALQGDPFGAGRHEIVDAMHGAVYERGINERRTIRHWMEDAYTWAAERKAFTPHTVRCAVGFKLADYQMGSMDTARMLAEHPKVKKIVLERRDLKVDYQDHLAAVAEAARTSSPLNDTLKLMHSSYTNLPKRRLNPWQKGPRGVQGRQRRSLQSVPVARDRAVRAPASGGFQSGQSVHVPAASFAEPWHDVVGPHEYAVLNRKEVVPRCRISNCTSAEFYDLHRSWFDTVRDRLITSGSTWMEMNVEETYLPCTWSKLLERILLYLGVDGRHLEQGKDCEVFPQPACAVEPQPQSETCDRAYLGRFRGHDVPTWARGWYK